MSDQPVVVQKISWQELFPWTILLKTLPVATSASVLVLAFSGLLLTSLGWLLSDSLFIHQPQINDFRLMQAVQANHTPYGHAFDVNRFPPPPMIEGANRQADLDTGISFWPPKFRDWHGPGMVFANLVKPFQMLFQNSLGGWEFCYFLLGGVWSLIVWSFFGLAITRICLMRLTRNEYSGLRDGLAFATGNWLTAISAIGIPLLAVAVLGIPAAVLGLLMGFDIGVLLVGIVWILVLALATAMAVILLGLMFGWPLMVASVATESQNSFDAMTRAFAYTFQRPVHYLFYALVAVLFGGFLWLVVASLTGGVIHLSYWSTSWGTELVAPNQIEAIVEGSETFYISSATNTLEVRHPGRVFTLGRNLIGFWNGVIRTIAAAFLYGLFWCFAAAIYLLLRRDVDETPMDEIFIVDEKRSYDLPPLKSDADGIPQVQTPEAVDKPDEPT